MCTVYQPQRLQRMEEESLQVSHHLLLAHLQKGKDETELCVELCGGSSPDSTSRAPSQLPLHETVTVQNRANALHQPGAQSAPAAIILIIQ